MFFSEALKGGSADPPFIYSNTEDDMDEGFRNVIVSLYAPNHVGVAVIKNVLDAESLQKIRSSLEANVKHFYPLKFGNVTRWNLLEEDFHKYPALELNRKNFRHITSQISSVIEINPVYQEKFSVMFYPEGSTGVNPHRDSEHSVNCVAIFILSGNSTFFVAKDTSCKEIFEFATQSGDVVLMRGPRSVGDILPRPIHYVGDVESPRYVVVCRHINLDGLNS